MASRKDLKEQARAQRLAAERASSESARRQRRLQMLGGIVVVAVVIIAVAIAVSSGGGSSTPGLVQGKRQSAVVSQVQSLLTGVPQSGATIGNPKAPVKVTYFGDLECPVCQVFTLQGGWPQFVSNDVRAGKVQVTYAAFQTATRDPQVFQTQQIAALSAGVQGKFWQYVELFYHEQGAEGSGYVTESYLDGIARQVPGLNYAQWLSERKNPSLLAEVQGGMNQGTTLGISGTPTLIFQGRRGKAAAPTGVPTYAQLEQTLKQVA